MAAVTLNKLASVINTIKWSKTSDFIVIMKPINATFQNLINWGNPTETQNSIDICLKSINLPQYTGRFEELLIGGTWVLARGADPVYQVDMTFRDFDNASMYRRFVNAFQISKGNYNDVCAWLIQVYLSNGSKNILVMETQDALLTDVSQIQLSQDNNEIVEFNVSFKMNQPNHDNTDIKNIQLAGTSNTTGDDSVQSKASSYFSNMLKNGLSAAQNAVQDTFENLVSKW